MWSCGRVLVHAGRAKGMLGEIFHQENCKMKAGLATPVNYTIHNCHARGENILPRW